MVRPPAPPPWGCRFKPDADDDLKDFDAIAGNEQQQPQEEELDDDEDLMVVGNVEKNEKCPYTRKDVSDLCTCCCQHTPALKHWATMSDALSTARHAQQQLLLLLLLRLSVIVLHYFAALREWQDCAVLAAPVLS